MNWYKDYKLVQNGDESIVEIYLNPDDTEFSSEFFTDIKENVLGLDEQIKEFIGDNFANIKVNKVKLLLGTMVIGTIPFMPYTKATAAELTPSPIQQTVYQTDSINLINTSGIVLVNKLNVRTGPATTYSIIYQLTKGNCIHVIGEKKDWYQVKLSNGTTCWASKQYITLEIPTAQQNIDLLISIAKTLEGTPYVWGGNSLQNGGFDCSGFTQYVFKQVGYTLNRISAQQATQGVEISRYALKPGDLVFFSLAGDSRISHVGLYIGDGKMIHSPKTGDTVKTANININFWQTHFITARRIFQ